MKSSGGITIVEAVVSILIAGFVLVGMLNLYSLGAVQSNIVKHKIGAANFAQLKIEGQIDTKYGNIIPGTFSEVIQIDTGKTGNTNDDINGTMVTNIIPISEGYKVRVTVSWNDYYGAMSEVMETIITSYE